MSRPDPSRDIDGIDRQDRDLAIEVRRAGARREKDQQYAIDFTTGSKYYKACDKYELLLVIEEKECSLHPERLRK